MMRRITHSTPESDNGIYLYYISWLGLRASHLPLTERRGYGPVLCMDYLNKAAQAEFRAGALNPV